MNANIAQTSLLQELIVDNFAGGGGASTGIELATGWPVDIAINHDPDAVLMHKTNHPYTTHYCESVWEVDPREITHGQSVGLAWFSPDCKHFSKAKGGKPVSKNIRGLAWIVLKWAGLVRPKVIILENVEEFQTWGPVRKGKAIKSKSGETFRQWKRQLEDLGYEIDHRELIAADYGAPTIRKRFFLIARCDGDPIVWPESTHSKSGTEGKPKWRSAAEIIDWSLPCPSIFDTREEIKVKYGIPAVRPLANNTMRRVARGMDKFVLKAAQPFIVPVGYGERKGQTPRVHDINNPLPTVVSTGKQYICQAALTMHNNTNAGGTDAKDPVNTITTGGQQMLITPALTAIGHTSGGDQDRAVTEPTHTTVSKAEECLIAPVLISVNHTASYYDGTRGTLIDEPVPTVTAKNGFAITAPSLIQYHSETKADHVRGQAVDDPIMTIDMSNRYGIAGAYMTEYYGSAQDGIDPQEPMHTVTSKDREGVTLAHISKFYGGVDGSQADHPLGTVTAIDHNAITATFVSKFYKTCIGQQADEPLHTITQSPGHFGEVRTRLVKYNGNQGLHYWPQVRELLNMYCGYRIADDEILLLEIGGVQWFISDIGLRMLTPKELYAANGFPIDYIIDRDYTGKAYGKTKQVARCGNAVPPPFATALVRANCPDLCKTDENLTDMQEINDITAV